MLGVDRLKELHRCATDALAGHRIVFHHVPKCGGTSIGRALRRAYFLSQGTVKPIESARAFETARRGGTPPCNIFEMREMMLLYLMHCDTRCIAAHIPFSDAAFDKFAGRYAFVTMLRDPVDRMISKFYYNMRRANVRGPEAELFDDYVARERAKGNGSTFVRYFTGNPAQGEGTPANVDAAVRNLHRLNFVGFLDEVPGFESALKTLTGRRIKIGRENVGRARRADSYLMSDEARAKIEALCSADLDVWAAAQDLRQGEPRMPEASVPEVAKLPEEKPRTTAPVLRPSLNG